MPSADEHPLDAAVRAERSIGPGEPRAAARALPARDGCGPLAPAIEGSRSARAWPRSPACRKPGAASRCTRDSSGELPCWILEDAPGPPDRGALPAEDEPTWVRGFPCWLGAAAGASVLVHTSAGSSLVDAIPASSLAVVSDHLNLSGRTPLLGPLRVEARARSSPTSCVFHHAALRARAIAIGARARARAARGRSRPPRPDRRSRRPPSAASSRAPAREVAVQGLESPLLAAAHAGLAVLAIVCVTDRGEERGRPGADRRGGGAARAGPRGPAPAPRNARDRARRRRARGDEA